MAIQDDSTAHALNEAIEETVGAQAGGVADDMRSILKLIATQIEDADRRHSQVLEDLNKRLNDMGKEARLTRARVPAEYAPAFERLQEGIELLAGLVASRDSGAAAAEIAQTALDEAGAAVDQARMSEEEADALFAAEMAPAAASEAAFEPADEAVAEIGSAVSHDEASAASFSDIFSEAGPDAVPADAPAADAMAFEAAPADADFTADPFDEDPVITDNAADRMDFGADADIDAASDFEAGSARAFAAEQQEMAEETHVESGMIESGASDAAADTQANEAAREEPPVFASVPGNADDPWDAESAEALTRVYETQDEDRYDEAGISEQAMFLAAPSAEFVPAAEAVMSNDYDAAVSEAPAPATAPAAMVSGFAPVIEQGWLEERFAEIALKIEESLGELRDDETLSELTNRFGDFEARMGSALEDVAKRHDLDALKSAEEQIDSMIGYFERVESQLARIDGLEQQMEALLARFSDESLSELLAMNAAPSASSETDLASIADAAAESVAQRFLADFGGKEGSEGQAVAEMRDALEAFMSERREHDAESAGMLDTIQQALIRVLDRVDLLENGYAENPPMQSPVDGYDPDAEAAYRDEDLYDADTEDERGMHDDEPETIVGPPGISAPPRGREDEEAPQPKARADYAQRLEYPAAVMHGQGAAGIPDMRRHEEEFGDREAVEPLEGGETHHEVTEQHFAEEAFNAQAEAAEVHGYAPEANGLDAPSADPNGELPRVSAIDRLRQEFIADAKMARARAAEQALAQDTAQPQPTSVVRRLNMPSMPKMPGLPGLGRGRAEAVAAPVAEDKPLAGSRSTHVEAGIEPETESAPGRFALSRRKMLVGAVIVLFATAGALLMMRGKPEQVDTAPPPALEQTMEPTGLGPELAGPEDGMPAGEGAPVPAPNGQFEEGRIYEDGQRYGSALSPVRSLSEQALPGVAVADLDKAPHPEVIAQAEHRRKLAKISSDLGAAAAYATPAHLMPEGRVAEGAEPGSVAGGTVRGNNLDLPPATVGPLTLRLAAAKGDPSAQFEVAARMASGMGTDQDLDGAVNWYKRSAAQGFAQAQYRLGTLYERGLGVDKDLARASVWYERAASQGNIKAMHNLAVVTAGRSAGDPDYKGASVWFSKAAEYGLSDSQFNMAVLHENGLGVAKDLKKAFVYYALAARAGDEQAKKRRDELRAKLSPRQVTEAELDVKRFRAKLSDKLVNDARAAGEDWKKRADHTL